MESMEVIETAKKFFWLPSEQSNGYKQREENFPDFFLMLCGGHPQSWFGLLWYVCSCFLTCRNHCEVGKEEWSRTVSNAARWQGETAQEAMPLSRALHLQKPI